MNLLVVIAPLISVIFAGFVCVRFNYLSASSSQQLSKITFNGAIPALLFVKMATAKWPENISLSYFLAFYLAVACCYALSFFLAAGFKAKSTGYKASFALGASYSNNVIVGLPLLLGLFGQAAMVYVFAIVTFHSALLFVTTFLLAGLDASNASQHNRWQHSLQTSLTNPLVLSISAGALINYLAIELPEVVIASLTLLSQPALPLALFILGANLVGLTIKGNRRLITLASLVKLILLPSLVWLFSAKVFALSVFEQQILVILSACPTGVNAYLVAKQLAAGQKTQVADDLVASTVVTTTLLAGISLPIWLWLVH